MPQTPDCRAPAPRTANLVMDVEDLLVWTFRDQLPKRREDRGGGGGQVSPMFRLGIFSGPIDNWSREPGMPPAAGEVHPDALVVEELLAEMGALTLENIAPGDGMAPDDFGLSPGFEALADQPKAVAGALRMVLGTVITCAKRGKRPPWGDERPVIKPVLAANHKPLALQVGIFESTTATGETIHHEELVEAIQRRDKSYDEGAFCPLRFDPDPQEIAAERAHYAVWWAVLAALAQKLSARHFGANGTLQSIAVLQPSAPQRPWDGERELGKPRRILQDLQDLSAPVYRKAAAEQRALAERQRMLGLRRALPVRTGPRRTEEARRGGAAAPAKRA